MTLLFYYLPDIAFFIIIASSIMEFFVGGLNLRTLMSQFRKTKLRQPIGQRLSNIRTQQKKFQSDQSYSYIMRKVWYHQI